MQLAMAAVVPFGDRRADLRQAIHTANLLVSQSTKEISEGDFGQLVKSLTTYLKCDEPDDGLPFDPAALETVTNGRHR